jgi:hypothetical protein
VPRSIDVIKAAREKWRGRRHLRRKKARLWNRKLRAAETALKALNAELEAARKTQGLAARALVEAGRLVGVMEHGSNNRGAKVEEIIRYAGGVVPEPWCVDFNIWCYGHAGSTIVRRGYTRAVRYMDVAGVDPTSQPRPGDMVRFTFDHTGLFVKDNGDGTITTIEGNTGASGARSDSSTGGDGVYIKVRAKSLVRDYLRVTA